MTKDARFHVAGSNPSVAHTLNDTLCPRASDSRPSVAVGSRSSPSACSGPR
jgi:hypothetical protein